jgi:hypothetical protein
VSNVPNKRDEKSDYKAAYIEEHESMMRAGNKDGAASVAKILKDVYDHDVDAKSKAEKKAEPEPPVERAVPEPAETPEKPEEPVRRGPGRPRKNPE